MSQTTCGITFNIIFDMPVMSSLYILASPLMSPSSASSLMGVSGHESDDTFILSEDGSPSIKRQRSYDEAKKCMFVIHSAIHFPANGF